MNTSDPTPQKIAEGIFNAKENFAYWNKKLEEMKSLQNFINAEFAREIRKAEDSINEDIARALDNLTQTTGIIPSRLDSIITYQASEEGDPLKKEYVVKTKLQINER